MMNILPIRMYEYMAAGTSVIATKLPGFMKEFGGERCSVYRKTGGVPRDGDRDGREHQRGRFIREAVW